MKKMMQIVALAFISNVAWAQNTGIGTKVPTHKLHVKDVSDPIRLEGLSDATVTTIITGTIVTDATGVLKIKNADNISAVRVTGNIKLPTDNRTHFTDFTLSLTPTESFDNLNEFSGHTFTAAQTGLYQVSFTGKFLQTLSYYQGYVLIDVGNGPNPPIYGTVDVGGIPPTISLATNSYPISVTKSELIKLTAGQIIQFEMAIYGASVKVDGSYVIVINRVD